MKNITKISEINNLLVKQSFNNLLCPDPCRSDYLRYNKDDRDQTIPNFQDLELVAFKIGLENYEHGLINHKKTVQILSCNKSVNYNARMFILFIHAVYSSAINKYSVINYYKKLTTEQQNELNNLCSNYLINAYNSHIDELIYQIENS